MKTLQPTSFEFLVPVRSEKPTEFEVQAVLYNSLKMMGLDVRGEISLKDRETRRLYRFDIVIYRDGLAEEIVEVKADEVAHRNGLENTRQARRYRQFGIPVTFVYGMGDVRAFVLKKQGRH